MSYNLVILKPPVPSDDAAAWQLARDHAMHPPPGETPQVFHDLIDRVTARYPCICDLPDDQADDGAWSDGPLRNNAGHAATILGLANERVDEVQPFVVETATALGLIVFDEQVGRIFRPGAGGAASSPTASSRPRPWWKLWGRE